MGINVGDAPPYKPQHIDFDRVARLRERLEEGVEENLIDGLDRLPMVSIQIEQRQRPRP